MKVTLTEATRVNAIAGTVEVDEVEANRLFVLGVAVPAEDTARKTAKKKKGAE